MKTPEQPKVENPDCVECGGTKNRHYPDCSEWIAEWVSPRRLRDEFAMAAPLPMRAGETYEENCERRYMWADAALEARKA